MKKWLLPVCISILFCCSGCLTFHPENTITQSSTIDALLAGMYDGNMSCGELLKHGNFGIGTFDRLDGEMIILDGKIYQVKADGRVYRPGKEVTTPFASVCHFSADETIIFKRGLIFQDVREFLNECIPNPNIFCAIKIHGTFSKIRTRSVPAQQKPYPPLAEVTANQPEFSMQNISGTIVGFRCPPYVKGINVPGYHLHFISDNFNYGGHILSFEMIGGTGEVDICHIFKMVLPEKGEALGKVDFSKDRSKELEQVEK